MAALAKRHEISRVVSAAVCQRQDVMHFLSERQSAFLFALLTNRMRLDIELTNAPPSSTVPLACVWITMVFVVMSLVGLPVLIAEPAVGQPAAIWVRARTLWFSWHVTLQA